VRLTGGPGQPVGFGEGSGRSWFGFPSTWAVPSRLRCGLSLRSALLLRTGKNN
jgi:hypothetical protein